LSEWRSDTNKIDQQKIYNKVYKKNNIILGEKRERESKEKKRK
jgi:hypothetical protein